MALLAVGFASLAAAATALHAVFPAAFELSSLLPQNGGDGTDGFVLYNETSYVQHISVSDAGDVNADGVDDLVIAHDCVLSGGECFSGVFVVFGGPGVSAGGSVDLASLDGTNGFVLTGIDEPFRCCEVSAAGDVNADGTGDLVIGSESSGFEDAGITYVVFGDAILGTGGGVDLSALDGANGFVLNGGYADRSGSAVSTAGDVNADGIDDLIVGAVSVRPGGAAYVIFGHAGLGASGSMDLASLDGTNGFVAEGMIDGNNAGGSVSEAGDVNGDGIDDVLIGASSFLYPAAFGATYVVFGGPGVGASGSVSLPSLDGTDGFVLYGTYFSDSGYDVSATGDVNDDGVDDLVIGAPNRSPDGVQGGASYVVFGGADVGAGGSMNLASLDGTNGFLLKRVAQADSAGRSVSGAGDVNGDGIADLIIGAPSADPGGRSAAGASYVVLGGAGLGAGGSVTPSSLDGISGVVLNGIRLGERTGGAVSGAGDVNADGIDDVIVGADSADGQGYVVFGRTHVDSDADGVSDNSDNCVLIANADQRDSDTDGFGNVCDADLNGDCYVNFLDLGMLRSVFFDSDPHADFDGNGVVDFTDLGIMGNGFFAPPGPDGVLARCD